MKLQYFKEHEFDRAGENWMDNCSPELLVKLDLFRHHTGKFIISPHPKAIGRRDDTTSQHNYNKWGEVRAIDGFPALDHKVWAFTVEYTVSNLIFIAESCGFTGIGIYPQWQLYGETRIGMHLDVRQDRKPGEPATWSYFDGKYRSLEDGLEYIKQHFD